MAGPTADAKLKIGADVTPAVRELNKLQGSMGKTTSVVKTGQERIEKLATAVTGASSVFGGMGAKAGAAAGAVSNLASAFLTGGPLLLGMAAATTVGAAMANTWIENKKKAEELRLGLEKFSKDLEDKVGVRLAAAHGRVTDLRDALADLNNDILFGQTGAAVGATNSLFQTNQREQATAESSLAAARKRVVAETKNLKSAQQDLYNARNDNDALQARNRITMSKRALDSVDPEFLGFNQEVQQEEAQMRALKEQERIILEEQLPAAQKIDEANAELRRLAEKARKADEDARARKRNKKKGRSAAFKRLQGTGDHNEMEATRAAFLKEEEKAYASEARFFQDRLNDEARMQEDAHANELKAFQLRLEREDELQAKQLEKKQKFQQDYLALSMQQAEQAIGFMASVGEQAFTQSLDVLETIASGQEVHFDRIAAAFIRSVGTQVFGIGIQSAAQGTVALAQALLPGQQGQIPGGLALLATGATLMAGGGSMAATGAVWQGLQTKAAAGGGGGDSGANLTPRGSSSGGGGGGGGDGETIVINFNGGTQLGDPTERARTMRRDGLRASRNVYLPGEN